MNLKRSWYVFGREVRLSPRSPLVLFAIGVPLLMTFLISAVFGSLFDPNPRLGIVDQDGSAVAVAAQEIEGVEVTLIDDVDELRSKVENHDLDAGMVLPQGFDAAIAAGIQPDLLFYVSGESLA